MGNNGCCTQHVDRLAGVMGDRPVIEPEHGEPSGREVQSTCYSSFFREKPAEILELAARGLTIEIVTELAAGHPPVAVLMPWTEYEALVGMRTKIAAITGGMQPGAR